MATSGFLLQLVAGLPAPAFLLVSTSVFQNSIDAARDRAGHRRLGDVGPLAASQPPVAPGPRALHAGDRMGRRDQGPTQPRWDLAGPAAVMRNLTTPVHARPHHGVLLHAVPRAREP